MIRIDFHPEATRELEASADWYLERSAAAARGFAIAVEASLEKIAADPARFPWFDVRHQSCGIERFPYQIIFRRDDERIFIIAIAHAKRRPGYWLGRT